MALERNNIKIFIPHFDKFLSLHVFVNLRVRACYGYGDMRGVNCDILGITMQYTGLTRGRWL